MYCYVQCGNCNKRYRFDFGDENPYIEAAEMMVRFGHSKDRITAQFWSKCTICENEEEKEVSINRLHRQL
jgi:hypothetical protein